MLLSEDKMSSWRLTRVLGFKMGSMRLDLVMSLFLSPCHRFVGGDIRTNPSYIINRVIDGITRTEYITWIVLTESFPSIDYILIASRPSLDGYPLIDLSIAP